MKYYSRMSLLALLAVIPFNGFSQEREVPIKYGDMEQWVTRKIHESSIIGGNTRLLYEIAPTQEVDGNVAYENMGGSPWGTSNVMAKVMGIVKTNNTVYKEKRYHGYCARLETHIERMKVLGMVNITVLAAGAIYLGDMKEPITSTKEGVKNMNWGIPFTEKPKALTAPALVACPKCGALHQPHRMCPECGTYNGRQVKVIESKVAAE